MSRYAQIGNLIPFISDFKAKRKYNIEPYYILLPLTRKKVAYLF
jgi:hypothetical protein